MPGFDQDFSKYLGDISRNSTGHIIGKKLKESDFKQESLQV